MYNWLNFIFTTGFTKAIISLRSERKFHIISLRSERKFQPLRGCASGAHLPQVSPVAIHIQPLRGWRVDKLSTKSVIIRIVLFLEVLDIFDKSFDAYDEYRK
jgi:hypothetical protein